MEENPYNVLASIYDAFQNRADTERFFKVILDRVMQYVPNGGLPPRPVVCDLGCGTGDMLLLLAQAQYDVIGVDQSTSMLNIAKNKLEEHGYQGIFVCQDITQFELHGQVDVFLCLTDTVNHILDQHKIEELFTRVSRYLKPGGIFIFDALTLDYMTKTLGNKTFCFNEDQYILVWENQFDTEKMCSRSDLLLFQEKKEGLYRRNNCIVREQYYSEEYIYQILSLAQMKCLDKIEYNDWFEHEKCVVRQIYVTQRT